MDDPGLREKVELRAAKREAVTLAGLRRLVERLDAAGAAGTTAIYADVSITGRRLTRIWAEPVVTPQVPAQRGPADT